MYIKFEKISYKNLLSVGNNPVELNFLEAPTTLLFGKNGNGKSSIIEAIHFALYGKAFRKIVKNQLVNNVNKKNLLVELWFSIGQKSYKIERGIRPNIFNVYCNGEKLDNDASAVDFQKELEFTILKMTRETFRQIVVLGSTSYVPFMRLNNRDRNLIIEDLLDIQIFSKMLIVLKQKLSLNKRSLIDINHSIELTTNSIVHTSDHIDKIQDNNDKLKKDNQKQIDNIKSKLNRYTNDKEKLNQMLIDNALDDNILEEKRQVRQEIVNANISIKSNLKEVNKLLDFFEHQATCPTCQQDITEETKKEKLLELESKSSMMKGRLDKNKTFVSKADKNIAKYEEHTRKLEELAKSIEALTIKISQEKALLRRVDSVVEIDNSESIKNLKDLNVELKKFIKKQQEISKFIEEYQFIQEILNENGIKSSIIKTYLPIINKIIQKYLQILEFDIEFEFDETFAERIKFAGREDVQYFALSEGQKLRLDLCLLFTFRDVSNLKNSTSTNLLIFDEIGGSSLDSEGMDSYLRIVFEDANKGSNILIISHDNYMQTNDVLDRSLEFRKDGTFTELLQEK